MYITDSLKYINDSVTSFFGGKSPSRRFADALKQASRQQPEETRTAEEIVSSISKKLERLKDDESI